MEFTIHLQVLGLVFLAAVVLGAVANKTNFCTMGAVSDWVNMGDTGRMRAWLFAMTVALLGVMLFEGAGKLALPSDTFPPYRTGNFAWLRYVLGGVLFGIGMTLGSGCGNKTLVRIGGWQPQVGNGAGDCLDRGVLHALGRYRRRGLLRQVLQ